VADMINDFRSVSRYISETYTVNLPSTVTLGGLMTEAELRPAHVIS